jgi:hypothetical protein
MIMREETEIFNKYPELFARKDLPITQSCMPWGLEIGRGWYGIIEEACEKIDKYCKENNIQIEFEQIKEKYDGLRIYYMGDDNYVDKVIEDAENKADITCCMCGKQTTEKHRYSVVCKDCKEKITM